MAAEFLLIVLLFGIIALGIRLAAGGMDHDRVRREVFRRGGSVESIHWRPFGRGWFGEKGDRIYEVVYRNERGRRVRASFKTSAFSGVYQTHEEALEPEPEAPWPEDPTQAQPGVTELEKLRRENERLRGENERLRRT